MSSNRKKLITFSIVLAVSLILVIVFALVDINLGVIKFSSIKSLIGKHAEVTSAEEKLLNSQVMYENTTKKLENEKADYLKEKQKYDAITDETINIIKNIKTEDKYSIEYMWIRLGNYAKVNNLSLVLVEPGGSENATIDSKENSKNTTSDKTKSVSSDEMDMDDTLVIDDMPPMTAGNTSAFKIQVTGSYIDVSSFVFEVENDKELRFKLDNIVMEYVSGTTIKATFNVKNLAIKK